MTRQQHAFPAGCKRFQANSEGLRQPQAFVARHLNAVPLSCGRRGTGLAPAAGALKRTAVAAVLVCEVDKKTLRRAGCGVARAAERLGIFSASGRPRSGRGADWPPPLPPPPPHAGRCGADGVAPPHRPPDGDGGVGPVGIMSLRWLGWNAASSPLDLRHDSARFAERSRLGTGPLFTQSSVYIAFRWDRWDNKQQRASQCPSSKSGLVVG